MRDTHPTHQITGSRRGNQGIRRIQENIKTFPLNACFGLAEGEVALASTQLMKHASIGKMDAGRRDKKQEGPG
jgi:hypothetical protein